MSSVKIKTHANKKCETKLLCLWDVPQMNTQEGNRMTCWLMRRLRSG